MNPNLYDLLDVDDSASADEIRAAWKAAIADLEPGDRRFRAFNDAAGVLLDKDKRSAYDAQIAADRETEAVAEPAPKPETRSRAGNVSGAAVAEVSRTQAPVEPDAAQAETMTPSARRAGPSLAVLATAAVVALAAVVLAVWVLTRPGVDGSSAQKQASAGVTSGSSAVELEVADKIVPAMSYDYRTLPADLKKLQAYMTPDMAAKQAEAWKSLSAQAKQQHAVVVSHTPSDAPATGLTRMSDDGTRAIVLAFIDQDVRKLSTAPFTLKMWATFVLEKDPTTGSWLVSNICTDSVCA